MSRVRQDAELQDGAVAAREDPHGGQALPVHRVLLQVQPELRPQDAPEVGGPPRHRGVVTPRLTIAAYRPGVLMGLMGFVGAVWREDPPLRTPESPSAEVLLF